MPYKRPARVLFVATDTAAADIGARAARLGAGWIEPRAALAPPQATALAWADLVVSLDQDARDTLPPLPPTARHVHWPPASATEREQRIRGMLGGLRLLSRIEEDTA